MIDFNTVLFRGSANGDIMTSGPGGELTEIQKETLKDLIAKSKAGDITAKQSTEMARLVEKRDNPKFSDTTIKRLIKLYAELKGRKEEIKSKYLEKGTRVENDGITLYSRVKKKAYFKNERHLTNKYVCGTPDMGDHDDITQSEETIDIKCSWSLITFLEAKFKDEASKNYDWQGNTYMALLPKVKQHRIAYCLVNSPGEIIMAEKKKLQWNMGIMDPQAELHPEFFEKCRQIEVNHIFDIEMFLADNPGFDMDTDTRDWVWDIPMSERVWEIAILRDDAKIGKLYLKIERCRKWMIDNLKA